MARIIIPRKELRSHFNRHIFTSHMQAMTSMKLMNAINEINSFFGLWLSCKQLTDYTLLPKR